MKSTNILSVTEKKNWKDTKKIITNSFHPHTHNYTLMASIYTIFIFIPSIYFHFYRFASFCSLFRDNSVLALHQFCGVIFHSFCLQTFFCSFDYNKKRVEEFFALKNNLREEKKIIFVQSYKKKIFKRNKKQEEEEKEKIPCCGCYLFEFRMCLSSTTT